MENIYTSGEYLKMNPTWHMEESPWKAKAISRMLQKHQLHPKTICEVGCGAGEVLRLLQGKMERDCEFWGYDISPQAMELCRPKANEKLHFIFADLQREQNVHFDMLLILDVLEHLEDYFSFFRNLHVKCDHVLLQLPLDISAWDVLLRQLINYRKTFGHIHSFVKETALQMVQEMGYEVIDYAYIGAPEVMIFSWSEIWSNPRKTPRRLLGIVKRALLKVPGALFFAVNRDMAVRILGGWRILILAK